MGEHTHPMLVHVYGPCWAQDVLLFVGKIRLVDVLERGAVFRLGGPACLHAHTLTNLQRARINTETSETQVTHPVDTHTCYA